MKSGAENAVVIMLNPVRVQCCMISYSTSDFIGGY